MQPQPRPCACQSALLPGPRETAARNAQPISRGGLLHSGACVATTLETTLFRVSKSSARRTLKPAQSCDRVTHQHNRRRWRGNACCAETLRQTAVGSANALSTVAESTRSPTGQHTSGFANSCARETPPRTPMRCVRGVATPQPSANAGFHIPRISGGTWGAASTGE